MYSNGKMFACDQWKGPPTTNKPIFHVRRCFQFVQTKNLGVVNEIMTSQSQPQSKGVC